MTSWGVGIPCSALACWPTVDIERNGDLILVNTSVLRYNNKQGVRNTFHPEGDCLDGFTIYGLQTEIDDE